MATFKLTYASMFNPPEEMHTRSGAAVPKVKGTLGKTHGMLINDKDHCSSTTYENRSAINTGWLLARLQEGTAADARLALNAARAAWPLWSSVPWQERVALVHKVADILEEKLYELAVATVLNVGKTRLESLG